MTWQEATAEQFNAQDKRFSYHAEFASTPFINHANVLEYQWVGPKLLCWQSGY